MARERTVFDNDMVAHVWAQQTQEHGRSANGNFYFRGGTLYSYGPHFVVGRFVTTLAGERVVLLNSGSYSVSTNRHQSLARRAVAHYRTFNTSNPNAATEKEHVKEVVSKLEAATRIEAKAARARKANREWYLDQGRKLRAEAEEYAQDFIGVSANECAARDVVLTQEQRYQQADREYGSALRYFEHSIARKNYRATYRATYNVMHRLRDLHDHERITGREATVAPDAYARTLEFLERRHSEGRLLCDRVGERISNFHEHAAREREVEARELASVVAAAAVKAWRDGDNIKLWEVSAECPTAARLAREIIDSNTMMRVEGDEVVTSRGARFPLEHAKRAWPLLKRIRATGEAWVRGEKGIHLGHFTIDRVAADGTVTAGCHTLRWSEVARLASSLGLD